MPGQVGYLICIVFFSNTSYSEMKWEQYLFTKIGITRIHEFIVFHELFSHFLFVSPLIPWERHEPGCRFDMTVSNHLVLRLNSEAEGERKAAEKAGPTVLN